MELALAVGMKNYDKRQDLAMKDAKREMERALKERNRWGFRFVKQSLSALKQENCIKNTRAIARVIFLP